MVKEYGDYGLLATSFVTGMVDGASFLNWGVFVGMQTGELFRLAENRSATGVVVGGCKYMCILCVYMFRDMPTDIEIITREPH